MNELIKDLYEFELSRKDGITSRLPFSLTILTLVGSLVAFLAKYLPSCTVVWRCVLAAPLLVAILALVCAAYNLYMCLLSRCYKALALGSEFLKWRDDVMQHFVESDRQAALDYIDRSLCERMVEATDVNSRINDIRTAHLNRSCISMGIAAVSAVLYAIILATSLI